jgi:hypothetical protein
MEIAETERFIAGMASRLGMTLAAADLPSVVVVWTVLEQNAAALLAYDLPERIEAAGIFRMPTADDG